MWYIVYNFMLMKNFCDSMFYQWNYDFYHNDFDMF